MTREVFECRLADAVRAFNAQPDPPTTLQRIIEITPEFFDSCDHVAVSLVERDSLHTPVASHERLREIIPEQYALGQGPCREAIRNKQTVIVDDIAADERWPSWGHAMVSELGIRSCLIFRLFTRPDDSWGALHIYSSQPHAFSDQDLLHGQTITAMAAVVLARSINDEHLVAALESRTVIGQAMGMLMERYGLDGETAFNAMRRMSSQENRKLRDLATEIVTTRQVPRSAIPADAIPADPGPADPIAAKTLPLDAVRADA